MADRKLAPPVGIPIIVRTGLETARFLTEVIGLTDEEVASATGVVAGSVRRWRSSDPNVGEPRASQNEPMRHIAAVADFVMASCEVEPPNRFGHFLRTPRLDPETFEPRTPLEDIIAGNLPAAVELALSAFLPRYS